MVQLTALITPLAADSDHLLDLDLSEKVPLQPGAEEPAATPALSCS